MNVRSNNNLKMRYSRSGSVLVMVVVLTVLLALIGVLFVVMARMDNMSASGVANNADLHAAVDAVVDKIKSVMVADLFGPTAIGPTERLTVIGMEDSPAAVPGSNPVRFFDPWLASLEPVRTNDGGTVNDESDDIYRWPYISDVYGLNFNAIGAMGYLDDMADPASAVSRTNVKAKIILPNDVITPVIHSTIPGSFNKNGAPADADGDGVSDSRWVVIPKMRSSRGKDIYTAVRVIDNCAMLNLNTAHSKDNVPIDEAGYLAEASYLSAVDYEKFLRGSDRLAVNLDNIRKARKPNAPVETAKDHHDNVVMHIENPGPAYSLFDIGDELEIRNRFMLTGRTESRFERIDVANYTLDAGGGVYGALEIPRTYGDDSDGIPLFTTWKWRVNPENFDNNSGGNATEAWKYDRRHICTFYSFDRNLRRRDYPLIDVTGGITGTPWTIGVPPLNIKDYSLLTPIIMPATTPAEILSTFDQDVFMIENAAVDLKEDFYSNTLQSRKNILHLLYAFRAYYIDNDPTGATDQDIVADAARRAAQYVANMIDYVDDTNPTTQGPFFGAAYGTQTNDNPTYINRAIIRQLIFDVSGDVLGAGNEIDIDTPAVGSDPYEFGLGLNDVANGFDETVYGYERQPFISEITTTLNNPGNSVSDFAVELCNPYSAPINLEGWQIVVGPEKPGQTYTFPAEAIDSYDVLNNTPGRLIKDNGPGGLMKIGTSETVKLQRPDPANPGDFITVDETELAQTNYLVPSLAMGFPATLASKRDDTNWRFVDNSRYTNDLDQTPNAANGVTEADAFGFQLPVANNNTAISSLHDFAMVTFLGNAGPNYDPAVSPVSNPVTKQIGQLDHAAVLSDNERYVRFDIAAVPALLEYASFVINRPERRLAGRINVNTATKEVLRAAIPEATPWWPGAAVGGYAETLAAAIVNGRPYSDIGELLNVPALSGLAGGSIDANIGDLEIDDDFEERDWILSRLANIFTVRSDTFTAYILVRIGIDGPQKRMIAILDRTGVSSPNDRPKLVALHPVPDPR